LTKLRRENHYLPVSYQRGFADTSGKVWVKFANEPNPVHRNPRSVGKRRDLYIWTQKGVATDNVEQFFGNQVESQFALLSQRIKEEGSKFSIMSGVEQGVLCRFIAAQTTRTLAHKHCMEQQAGTSVDTNTFVRVMLRQTHALIENWRNRTPTIHFFTSLPLVGEHYVTGDSPVLAIQINESRVWMPGDTPQESITNLTDILSSPKHCFMIALSPYICVSVQNWGDGQTHLPPTHVPPRDVQWSNDLVRTQSREFVIALRKESLPRHLFTRFVAKGA